MYFQGSRPDCFGLIARSQAHTAAAACLPLPKPSDYLSPILTTLLDPKPCEFPIFNSCLLSFPFPFPFPKPMVSSHTLRLPILKHAKITAHRPSRQVAKVQPAHVHAAVGAREAVA
jgi:hypothetical protein